MKTSSVFILLFSLVFCFSSCRNESPLTKGGNESIQWQLFDTLQNCRPHQVKVYDENNIFIAAANASYKINNGVRTKINFKDSLFVALAADALSPSYYVFGGGTSRELTEGELKIFDGSELSVVKLKYPANVTFLVKIIERGKILAVLGDKIFIYESGKINSFSPGEGKNIYRLAGTWPVLYFGTTQAYGNHEVYKFENDSLTLLYSYSGGIFFLSTDNEIIKMSTPTDSSVELSYWKNAGWEKLFLEKNKTLYFNSTGQNTGFVYLIGSGDSPPLKKGVIWNGEKITADTNYPHKNIGGEPVLSNMKSETFFLTYYPPVSSDVFIYKGKRVRQ